ncbi:MAG: di-heme oxidoredictase family protein, partial [Acidobacteriota bacterium]
LRTGKHEVRALSRKWVAAFTDLLLHDMGPDLGDVCLGLATPSEFRTEPLMGLRLKSRFLHDGRAGSVEEAIRLHGGEAAAARDRFGALPENRRQSLIRFLKPL